MSTADIGDPEWAEMTTAQQTEAVLANRATLRQIVAGLLDGSDQLREACRQFLLHTDASLRDINVESEANAEAASTASDQARHERNELNLPDSLTSAPRKRRQGLPPGYTPRSTPQ